MRLLSLFACAVLAAACSSSSTSSTSSDTPAPYVRQYAENVGRGYGAALDKARALETAIDAFTSSPSAATLDAAKTAWLAARDPYGRTEVFRFYGGPIDSEQDGPEGRINGWPLDENYIDYTKDDPDAGIINHPNEFPTIDVTLVRAENEKGGEKNISCGFHAIEFLLWGQDTSADGPGARPFTDYVAGTGKNAERRAAFLKATTKLLVEDLQKVVTAWDLSDPQSYGTTFLALSERDAEERILKGMTGLAGIELARERLLNAYSEQDQEEEHSCFSDNTQADLLANLVGIEDVYYGRSGSVDGPGLDEALRAKDPVLEAKVREHFTKAVQAMSSVPVPFDQAIGNEAGRTKIKAAIDATKELTDALLEVGKLDGLTIILE